MAAEKTHQQIYNAICGQCLWDSQCWTMTLLDLCKSCADKVKSIISNEVKEEEEKTNAELLRTGMKPNCIYCGEEFDLTIDLANHYEGCEWKW